MIQAGFVESGSHGELVAKAVFRAADALGLNQVALAQIIGVSSAQMSKLKNGTAVLQGKPFESAVYVIRIFRSLDTITGGDAQVTIEWMRNMNYDLNGKPVEMIKTGAGLIDVMNYLDAIRAPL